MTLNRGIYPLNTLNTFTVIMNIAEDCFIFIFEDINKFIGWNHIESDYISNFICDLIGCEILKSTGRICDLSVWILVCF